VSPTPNLSTHNVPQEAPEAFAEAVVVVVDVDGF
jgi:hypothetical protein